MKLLNRIHEDYRKNKGLFFLKLTFRAISIFFSLIVIVVSVSALMKTNGFPLPANYILLLAGMLFFSGMVNVITLYEMSRDKKKEHFKSILYSTVFTLFISITIFISALVMG